MIVWYSLHGKTLLITTKNNDMISNPFTWNPGKKPIKGYKKDHNGYVSFTYKPGKYLYHFDASDCDPTGSHIPGWEHYMGMNILLFANSKKHAVEIFEAALKLRVQCADNSNFGDAQVFLDNKHKWKFTRAPLNQVYHVGWAVNDTIL